MIPFEKCGLSEKTQQQILSVLKKYAKIEKVILYGSRSKGNFKNGSDIDLTVVAPTYNLAELFKIENDLDDLLLPYKIDLSLFHLIDNKDLIEHIQRVGIEMFSG